MERCSAITLASAMLGMHSMRPSSGEVASTLHTGKHNSLCRTCLVKEYLQCLLRTMLTLCLQWMPQILLYNTCAACNVNMSTLVFQS